MNILDFLKDFIFSPRAVCMGCGSRMGSDENWLCASCRDRLEPLYDEGKSLSFICRKCGHTVSGSRCPLCGEERACRAAAAYGYEPVIKKMVAYFKYRSVYRMDEWMAGEMKKALDSAGINDFTLITAVPLHKSRKAERGYNQSEKLALKLCGLTGREYSEALVRVRRTKQQAKLSAEERRKNLKGAFSAACKLKGERVLLVDDVRTTGSTCAQCIKELYKAGAEEVTAVTFAAVHE